MTLNNKVHIRTGFYKLFDNEIDFNNFISNFDDNQIEFSNESEEFAGYKEMVEASMKDSENDE